jgi:hypothetical protein
VPRVKGNYERYQKLLRQAADLEAGLLGRSTEDYYRTRLIDRHASALEGEGLSVEKWGLGKLERELIRRDGTAFERRAKLLTHDHPLGLQVQLSTGVANGVLVARTLSQCGRLIRRIVTNQLRFRTICDEDGTLRLEETLSRCTFRVMVRNDILTNSFWNFYRPWLRPQET